MNHTASPYPHSNGYAKAPALRNNGLLPGLHSQSDGLAHRFLALVKRALSMTPAFSISSKEPPLTRPSSGALASNPYTFIILCGLWYASSALSSNTGKQILNLFLFPVTLTIVQFFFVAFYCLLLMSPAVRFSKLRTPTRAIIKNTLPMGMFQVGGHMFSSIAMSRIPVSTVHTIKALSPLFTVAAYALVFGVSYSSQTYISLLPLTLGVMLACSFDMSASNYVGLLCAFGSALVFVSSNIFFKKIMPSHGAHSQQGSAASHKLDKLNLLLYSSGMAFILMVPIWLYYDLAPLLALRSDPGHVAHPKHQAAHSVTYYFFMNGTVHFGQNLIAFIILSSTSPVTYSIASLIKRVVVILIAIAWFNQSVHPIQAVGIVLTFAGLWMYNNAKSDVEKGERKAQRVEAIREGMLPVTRGDERLMGGFDEKKDYVEASGMEGASMRLTGRGSHPPVPQHPPLHLKMPERREIATYPSPPPSLDSPPPHHHLAHFSENHQHQPTAISVAS